MVRTGCSRWLFLLLLAAEAAQEPAAPPLRVPVGLLLEARPGTQLKEPGTETPVHAATTGDLIYANSRLVSGGGPVAFAFYPGQYIYTFTPPNRAIPAPAFDPTKQNSDYELYFEMAQVTPRGGKLSPPQRASWPLVAPQSDGYSITAVLDVASVKTKLSQVEAALKNAQSPRDQLMLRLSRAALLEQATDLPAALQEYERIASTWKDAGWIAAKKRLALQAQIKVNRQKELLANAAGKTYAMIIGISDYQYSSRGALQSAVVPPVQFADKDAQLIRDQFARVPAEIPTDNVVTLVNSQATKAAIDQSLKDLLERRAGPRDTVYIFMSGQGWTEKIGGNKKAFLMPYDSDPQDKYGTGYPLDSLIEVLGRNLSTLKQVYLVADICRMEAYRDAPNTINAALRDQVSTLNGKVELVLSSSAGAPKPQVSRVDPALGGGHSLFTYYFVQALQGAASANRGHISTDDLFRYVSAQVGQATHDAQQPARFGHIALDLPVAVPTRAAAEPALARTGFLAIAQLAMAGFYPPGLLAPRPRPAPQPEISPIDLENQGQQILLRYLNGEEEPQDKAEFVRGSSLFGQANRRQSSIGLRARELFCEGRALVFDKNPDAVDRLANSIELDPDAAYTYNALGIAHLEQARYSEAAWAFRDAIRRAPTWIYPRHNLALTYSEAGAYTAAEREYRDALRIEPKYFYVHYSLGLLLQRVGRIREAAREYQAAIEINPRRAEAYTGLGAAMAAMGKPLQAEQNYTKAIDLNPKLPAPGHDLGLLYKKWRRTRDALTAWERNIENNPDFVPTRVQLAQEYRAEGRLDDAIAQYQAVVSASPKDAGAAMALAETTGDRDAKAGRKEAADQYRKALSLAIDKRDIKRIKHKLR